MPKESVFTMKLESELRKAFMDAAQASHRPASQILREMMRDFIQRQSEAHEYKNYLQQKVAQARSEIIAGHYSSAEEVELRATERRAQLLASTKITRP